MQILKSLLIIISSLACICIVITTIASASEAPVHSGYPFVFDMTGKLERLEDDDLVVEDVLFKLTSSTTYQTPDAVFASKSDFQQGDKIGLVLSDKQKRIVKAVYLIVED